MSLCNIMCALCDIKNFEDMVRNVYFPTEDFTEAGFTIVNAGLYMLFLEHITFAASDATKQEYEVGMNICMGNLETCLLNMPLFLSTRPENVQALYFGVSSRSQLCKRSGKHRDTDFV